MEFIYKDLKSNLENWKKELNLPIWKQKYLNSLIEKAMDFKAVGQFSVYRKLESKIQNWLLRQKPTPEEEKKQAAKKNVSFWKKQEIITLYKETEAFLHEKMVYIPKPEQINFFHDLETISTQFSKDEVSLKKVKEQLILFKLNLYDRLHRSLRAHYTTKQILTKPSKIDAHVGPYNNTYNLNEVFKLVSERDPIWIADIVEVYGKLFKLENRIVKKNK